MILGLPRGGVVVAHVVARELAGHLAALAVKKVTSPLHPELAIGAVAADGTRIVNTGVAELLGLAPQELEAAAAEALAEARRRQALYGCDLPPLAGRTVIIVDDGLATGYTAVAAARSVRAHGPGALLVAVPVAARASLTMVGLECDRVVAVSTPDDFDAVGQWYDDFSPVDDATVLALLGRSGPPGPPCP